MAKNKPPFIHVVLDTNCLFTEAADKLISSELSSFILNDSKDLGLQIFWHIPSVVKAERKHQMMERGKKLLPALAKIENLLGHALGINEAVLDTRVDDAIRRQIDQHNLSELNVTTQTVDWDRLINRALLKLSPFENGEKEKGFRDALILEATSQLADETPKSNSVARLVLLSSDKLLQDAARERFADRTNVLVAETLDEIRTMLNAVASQLTQETINSILPKVSKLFFEESTNRDTFYYKAKVSEEIQAKFPDTFNKQPGPEFSVFNKRILIARPTFLSKTKQRLSLSSKITFELEATKQVARAASGVAASPSSASLASLPPKGLLDPSLFGATSRELFDEVKRIGTAVFEVYWSVTLNKRGTLSNPHLDKIDLRSSSWED